MDREVDDSNNNMGTITVASKKEDASSLVYCRSLITPIRIAEISDIPSVICDGNFSGATQFPTVVVTIMRQTTNPLKVGVKISPIDCRLRNQKFFNLTDDQLINFFE